MAKQIKLEYCGEIYTLEFNRKTIKELEKEGFNINEFENQPVNTISQLFHGAFLKNHPTITNDRTDEILASIEDKTNLIEKLCVLYQEPLSTLVGDNVVDESKKVKWEGNW